MGLTHSPPFDSNHRIFLRIRYPARMRLRVLFAVTIFASPLVSSADEPGWVAIGRGDSFTQYVDVNSLGIRAGRLTASTLTDFAAPQQNSGGDIKPYRSLRTLNMYDCSADRTGVLNMTFYADGVGKGEVLKTVTFKPAAVVMNHSSPGSLGHKEVETVCSMWSKAFKRITSAAKAKPAA
jgi:hypothetical protein